MAEQASQEFPLQFDTQRFITEVKNMLSSLKIDYHNIQKLKDEFLNKHLVFPEYAKKDIVDNLSELLFSDQDLLLRKPNCIDLVEFMFYLYMPDFNNSALRFESSFSPKDIFFSTSVNQSFNSKIDHTIYSILFECPENNVKEALVYIPMLVNSRKSSTWLSFKIIALLLIAYSKLQDKGSSHLHFPSIITYISEVLLKEAILFSKFFNCEVYDNKFADFEYNIESTDLTRKTLTRVEFDFCRLHLFDMISLIISHLASVIFSVSGALFSKGSWQSFYKIFDLTFENTSMIKVNDKEGKTIELYLLLCFIAEIYNFLFSNMHYLDKEFNANDEITLNITQDIFMLKEVSPLIRPHGYEALNKQVFEFLRRAVGPNFLHLIEHFLFTCEFKSSEIAQYEKIKEKSDSFYFLNDTLNQIGFSVICVQAFRDSKCFFPLPLSSNYMLNNLLPIAAALLKREQNFKYFGLEIILSLFKRSSDFRIELREIQTYSILDIINDLVDFVGGPEPQPKRVKVARFFSETFLRKFDRQSVELIYNELIIEYLNTDNKVPEGGIRDKQTAFLITSLKSHLKVGVDQSTELLLSKGFLQRLICKVVNCEIFVLDVLEIISAGLNLLLYLVGVDRSKFGGDLGFFTKSFLSSKSSELNEIVFLVKKWVNRSDKDKLDFIQNNYDASVITRTKTLSNYSKNEDTQSIQEYNDLIKKNQAEICLNLLVQVDSIFHSYSKELSETQAASQEETK